MNETNDGKKFVRVLSGHRYTRLGKALTDAGIIPPGCGDIVIDIPVDGVVTISGVWFADEKIADVLPAELKKLSVLKSVDDEEDEKGEDE